VYFHVPTRAYWLMEMQSDPYFSKNSRPPVVLDGAKGLRATVRDVRGDDTPVRHCQWHKRENVVSYLAKEEQPKWRRKLQAADAHPAYTDAKRALERLVRELALVNESAARTLEEGLEETLTLHNLGVFPEMGTGFKTTNLIESVMARVEAKTQRVDRWKTSDRKLRWCATTLLIVENHFRRVRGCDKLHLLQQAWRRISMYDEPPHDRVAVTPRQPLEFQLAL